MDLRKGAAPNLLPLSHAEIFRKARLQIPNVYTASNLLVSR